MFERERAALEQRLANRGITAQSNPDAYGQALAVHGQARNDAYAQALGHATRGAASEQSRLVSMAASARERALQEQLALRNQPVNELAALLGAAPGISVPSFRAPPPVAVPPADVTGPTLATYQMQLDSANQAAARQAGMWGPLFSLGGTLLGGAMPWWM